MLPALSNFMILIASIVTMAHAWTSLSPPGWEAFAQGYSWYVGHNWRFCAQNMVQVPLYPGRKDYEPAITAALTLLSASGGGTLRLQPGVYTIGAPVKVPSRTCMFGAGMEKTVLRVMDNSRPFYPAKGAVHSSGSEWVTLHNFSIDGNRHGQGNTPNDRHGRHGIFMERVKYAWIRQVSVRNNLIHGFFIRGTRDEVSSFVAIDRCVAETNDKDVTPTSAPKSEPMEEPLATTQPAVNNDPIDDPIILSRTSFASILYSNTTRSGRNGIHIEGGKYILVRGGMISDSGTETHGGCGIRIDAPEEFDTPKEVRVESTHIADAMYTGICVFDAKNVWFGDVKVRTQPTAQQGRCMDATNSNFSGIDLTCE